MGVVGRQRAAVIFFYRICLKPCTRWRCELQWIVLYFATKCTTARPTHAKPLLSRCFGASCRVSTATSSLKSRNGPLEQLDGLGWCSSATCPFGYRKLYEQACVLALHHLDPAPAPRCVLNNRPRAQEKTAALLHVVWDRSSLAEGKITYFYRHRVGDSAPSWRRPHAA